MFGAEANGSGFHPVMVEKKEGHDKDQNFLWIFALIIIFAFVLFWNRRDQHKENNAAEIIPAVAAMQMANQGNQGKHNDLYIWDSERDNMHEFANLRQEISDKAHVQTRENDRYFYENKSAVDRNYHEIALRAKDNEVLSMKNTAEIKKEIADLRDQIREDKLRDKDNEVNHLKTVMALQNKAPIPAYTPQYQPCYA